MAAARYPLVLTAGERAMLADTWPLDLITDNTRQPREVFTPTAFAAQVLLADHLEDVVVFRNGERALGLAREDCLPAWVGDCLEHAKDAKGASVLKFLQRAVGHPESRVLKANVEFTNSTGTQKEIKVPRSRSRSVSRSPRGRSRSPNADRAQVTTSRSRSRSRSRSPVRGPDDEDPRSLGPRLRAVEARLEKGDAKAQDLYVCELRRIKSVKQPPAFPVPHPCALLGARRTKTLRKRQVADALGDLARWTLSWDTQDDGVFVGGRGAGKGLHVDQVLWSNVGHNYTGYKLLATWAPGAISTRLHDTMLDSVFTPPLKADQLDALKEASRIVLLRPGDVFLMSGGVAHATLTVGAEELNITAYESVVTLNPRHVRHFLRTGDKEGPYATERGGMPRRELKDFKDSTIDALEALAIAPYPDFRTALFDVTDADAAALRSLLRDHVAATVDLLEFEDGFYRKHVPPRLRAFLRNPAPEPPAGPSDINSLPRYRPQPWRRY